MRPIARARTIEPTTHATSTSTMRAPSLSNAASLYLFLANRVLDECGLQTTASGHPLPARREAAMTVALTTSPG